MEVTRVRHDTNISIFSYLCENSTFRTIFSGMEM